MVEATVHGYGAGCAPLVGLAEGRVRWGVSPSGRLELREEGLLPQLSVRAGAAASQTMRADGMPLPERQALLERLGADPAVETVTYKGLISYRIR